MSGLAPGALQLLPPQPPLPPPGGPPGGGGADPLPPITARGALGLSNWFAPANPLDLGAAPGAPPGGGGPSPSSAISDMYSASILLPPPPGASP